MERLKRKGIEINYQKIPNARQNSQAVQNLCEYKMSLNEFPSFNLAENFFNFYFPIYLVCELGVKGFSIVIDVTLNGCDSIRDMMKSLLIPYFNFDFSVQSFVRAMKLYLSEREAIDAVFILEDQEAREEALSNFLSQSTLRTIFLDQLPSHAARRLKSLRPSPNFFAIIADSINMKSLFRSVRNYLFDERQ